LLQRVIRQLEIKYGKLIKPGDLKRAIVAYPKNTPKKIRKPAKPQQRERSTQSTRGTLLLLFAMTFLAYVTIAMLADQLPEQVFWSYWLASAMTFIVYRRDKSAAIRYQSRTPEKTLHLLALVGGWPGAILAQRLFRHKSKKLSFQIIFWATVMLNCLVLAWLLSSQGTTLIDLIVSAM
jgi:uncharacterized membrane protein YsdA (DUF1294 family)